MDYIEAAEARTLPGVRLVVAKGGWAVWSECAKNILHAKHIPFTAVAQYTWGDNPELVAWTGHRNQPQLVVDDQPARTSWIDILHYAEKAGSGPPLIPAAAAERAAMFGLANELCGEGGFGWTRRQMSGGLPKPQGSTPAPDARSRIMAQSYGAGSDEAAARAPARLADILHLLAATLQAQRAAGRRYFVGDALSAVDIYWACFSNLVDPIAPPHSPMSDQWRGFMADVGPVVAAAIDPILIEHRDHVYRSGMIWPIDF